LKVGAVDADAAEGAVAARHGALARAVGFEGSSYDIGVLVRVVMTGVAIYLWRNPDIAKAGEDEGANGRSSPLLCRQFRSPIP